MENKKIYKEIRSWIVSGIIALVIVLLLNNFVLRTARVDGNSMYKTLSHNDFGITWVYPAKTNNIKRFDIVVIDEKEQGLWVKRVVGLPNETLEYIDGKLYINEQIVAENFLTEPFNDSFPKITLQADEYFVVGDNRDHSTDSRIIGPVKKSTIQSVGFFVLLPFENFGAK